jgi:hypothetical protein
MENNTVPYNLYTLESPYQQYLNMTPEQVSDYNSSIARLYTTKKNADGTINKDDKNDRYSYILTQLITNLLEKKWNITGFLNSKLYRNYALYLMSNNISYDCWKTNKDEITFKCKSKYDEYEAKLKNPDDFEAKMFRTYAAKKNISMTDVSFFIIYLVYYNTDYKNLYNIPANIWQDDILKFCNVLFGDYDFNNLLEKIIPFVKPLAMLEPSPMFKQMSLLFSHDLPETFFTSYVNVHESSIIGLRYSDYLNERDEFFNLDSSIHLRNLVLNGTQSMPELWYLYLILSINATQFSVWNINSNKMDDIQVLFNPYLMKNPLYGEFIVWKLAKIIPADIFMAQTSYSYLNLQTLSQEKTTEGTPFYLIVTKMIYLYDTINRWLIESNPNGVMATSLSVSASENVENTFENYLKLQSFKNFKAVFPSFDVRDVLKYQYEHVESTNTDLVEIDTSMPSEDSYYPPNSIFFKPFNYNPMFYDSSKSIIEGNIKYIRRYFNNSPIEFWGTVDIERDLPNNKPWVFGKKNNIFVLRYDDFPNSIENKVACRWRLYKKEDNGKKVRVNPFFNFDRSTNRGQDTAHSLYEKENGFFDLNVKSNFEKTESAIFEDNPATRRIEKRTIKDVVTIYHLPNLLKKDCLVPLTLIEIILFSDYENKDDTLLEELGQNWSHTDIYSADDWLGIVMTCDSVRRLIRSPSTDEEMPLPTLINRAIYVWALFCRFIHATDSSYTEFTFRDENLKIFE